MSQIQPTAPRKKGIPRRYVRDTLSKTKRGRDATKAVEKTRIKALRTNRVPSQSLKQIENLNADRQLTEKMRLFVRFWAAGETPRTAATMAGYSASSANIHWKWMHDPAILKIYREEKKLYEAAGAMTRQRVMDMLKEAYDMAKITSEPSTMVAAAREIGKMCGYYEPDVKININIGAKLTEKLTTMSDEQLIKLIEEEGGDILEGESVRVVEAPQLEGPK